MFVEVILFVSIVGHIGCAEDVQVIESTVGQAMQDWIVGQVLTQMGDGVAFEDTAKPMVDNLQKKYGHQWISLIGDATKIQSSVGADTSKLVLKHNSVSLTLIEVNGGNCNQNKTRLEDIIKKATQSTVVQLPGNNCNGWSGDLIEVLQMELPVNCMAQHEDQFLCFQELTARWVSHTSSTLTGYEFFASVGIRNQSYVDGRTSHKRNAYNCYMSAGDIMAIARLYKE